MWSHFKRPIHQRLVWSGTKWSHWVASTQIYCNINWFFSNQDAKARKIQKKIEEKLARKAARQAAKDGSVSSQSDEDIITDTPQDGETVENHPKSE